MLVFCIVNGVAPHYGAKTLTQASSYDNGHWHYVPLHVLLWTKKLNSVAWVRERTVPTKNDRRLTAKLMPTFANRKCYVVSLTDPYGHILGFLDRSRYFSFQVALQLYSRVCVDPVRTSMLTALWLVYLVCLYLLVTKLTPILPYLNQTHAYSQFSVAQIFCTIHEGIR
jgi:hypothetical protein